MFDSLFYAIEYILLGIIIVSILRKPKEDYHSHWSKILGDFKFSTKQFYELLRNELQSHQLENLSFEEVSLKTGNMFSSERLYLRVKWRNEYRYDLCFAPFGDGSFVSWWLIYETTHDQVLVSKIPFIGNWLIQAFYPKTYYKIDTASAFMSYAQNSVLAVIDQITKDTGIRLTEAERKPIMKDIFLR